MIPQDLEHIVLDIARVRLATTSRDMVEDFYCEAKGVDVMPQYDSDKIMDYLLNRLEVFVV